MNKFQIPCDGKPTNVVIKLSCSAPQKVRIIAFNPNRPKTYYINRVKTVKGKGVFEVRMPQNCDVVGLNIIAVGGSGGNLKIDSIEKTSLEQFNACFCGSRKVASFVKFAQEFSEQASILSQGTYFSDDKKFRIDYHNQIKDKGRVLATPARISNVDGRMEVSKEHFASYTVPMRMAILLHEFSHFNLNVIQKDEIEADLNALKIYLGLGYPVIEAHNSFINVFKKTPTNQNKERYQYIKTFIDNFDQIKYRICI
jgi:hypothetical protein